MATRYRYKVLVIVPQAEAANFRAFVRDNIDPVNFDKWLVMTLSATGEAPATHGWTCFHATEEQAAKWRAHFAAKANTTAPANFTQLSRGQQRAWQAQMKAGFLSQGIFLDVVYHAEKERHNTNAALQAMGLQRVISSMGG